MDKKQEIMDRIEQDKINKINKRRDKKIKRVHKTAILFEEILYRLIGEKDNHMNVCACEERVSHNFINTEKINNIFCLNCGGYVELDIVGM